MNFKKKKVILLKTLMNLNKKKANSKKNNQFRCILMNLMKQKLHFDELK